MDSELFKKLITEPEHWVFYLCLGGAVIFVLKLIGIAADAVAKRLSTKIKQNKGLLNLCGFFGKMVAIALVIYIANAIYWSLSVEELVVKRLRKPIIECLYQNTTLEGQLVDCFHQQSNAISGIVIQNVGDGIVFDMDIYLYLKFEKPPSEFSMTWWHNLDHIDESDFDRAFEYVHTITNVHPQKFFGLKIGQWARVEKGQKVKALLKIYYGEPEPLRINWSINVK